MCNVQSVDVSVTARGRRRIAEVTFSAAPLQADAEFECSLDGGNFRPCKYNIWHVFFSYIIIIYPIVVSE